MSSTNQPRILMGLLPLVTTAIVYAAQCTLPHRLGTIAQHYSAASLRSVSDVHRNYQAIRTLCIYRVTFSEHQHRWDMLLVTNPHKPHGPFWFLPHDNENSAFDTAVYATRKYGGGFLAVMSHDKRYHQGQDPNRNFSMSRTKVPSCRHQKAASPIYTRTVFSIIDAFRDRRMPYLALHNNTNGGGVSVLRQSRSVRSFTPYSLKQIQNGSGLADEDNLVYIASTSSQAPRKKIEMLKSLGMNVKYEIVSPANNDCSMSNYVVLGKHSSRYYNIEAQHGHTRIQKQMVDLLMKKIAK
jgi:hypothetical protein